MQHASMPLPRTVLLSLAALLLSGTAAQADPINVNYSTSMAISNIGVDQGTLSPMYTDGASNVSLMTQATSTFGTILNPMPSGVGTSLPLGQLSIPLPPDPLNHATPSTFDNTPFYLTVTVNSVNGDTHAADPQSFIAYGYLNGNVSINGPSSLTATFIRPDTIDPRFPQGTIASFSSGGYDTFLAIPTGTVSVSDPNGVPGAIIFSGEVVSEYAAHPAPEPGSLVVLGLLGLAQVGAFRWRNRRRRCPTA